MIALAFCALSTANPRCPHSSTSMKNQGIKPRLRVLMLPWLAHGHISPFLELAKSLSRHNIFVYLCSSPVNINSVKHSQASPLINFVELHLPNLLPPHLHTTKNLPPHLMPTLKAAFDAAETAFGRLLDDLSPDLIFYDFITPWPPLVAVKRNIPAVLFFANAAATTTLFCHHLQRPTEQPPFPSLRFVGREKDVSVKMLTRSGNGQTDAERYLKSIKRSSGFIAFRSFREIEGKYLDYLPSLLGKAAVPVGPLVSALSEEDCWQDQHQLAEWLREKPAASVVFVSLGSEYFMTEEEMEEMAIGLELCKFSFIWVVRFPFNKPGADRSTSFSSTDEESANCSPRPATSLPDGFFERLQIGEKGVIIEGWAPHKNILSHPSVGGFLTHCGWSSFTEGMKLGVPMIALPLQIDQPVNARLGVELGVALQVKTEAVFDQKLQESVNKFRGEDVARCVEEVVGGEEGVVVRRRVKEMAELMAGKGHEEMEMFVEKIAGWSQRARCCFSLFLAV